MRRVVITGLGVLCAAGNDRASFADSLRNGRSGIRPLSSADPARLRIAVAAEVQDFDGAAHFDRSQLNLLDRFAQLGVVAWRKAMAEANLPAEGTWKNSCGVIMGACVAGQITQDDGFVGIYKCGGRIVGPFR